MGERRSRRRERLAEEEAARLGMILPTGDDRKQALGQRAGDARRSGDAELSRRLEAAMRHRERPARATHGFHTYPAGLHPDTARDLLELGDGPVLDPFCGGGTVLVESVLAGREALGLDISPIACLVARTRTARTDEAARTALRGLARRAAEAALHAPPLDGQDPRVPVGIGDWYDPHALGELVVLRDAIGNDDLARAVFSAIVVKASRRESDTSNVRTEGTRPAGTTATLFHRKARELARMFESLEEAAPAGVRARVHREDARHFRTREPFGMALTSPPYPGVYDYVPMQQLRLAWMGADVDAALRAELGPRRAFRADRKRALAAWREDTRRWVRAVARALRDDGRMCVVIGDGNVMERPVDSLGPLDEAASAAGMARIACASVERWDAGVRAVRMEHAVLYERRGAVPGVEG